MKILSVLVGLFICSEAFAFPMRLDWDAVTTMTDGSPTTAVAYRVYRRNAFPDTATWYFLTQTILTHYSASQLQFGQFIYRVTAVSQGQESDPSAELKIAIELDAKEVQ